MTDFQTYLKGVQAKLGLKSDRQLSLALGISTASMYHITRGSGIPSDELCLKIAKLAGDPPERVLLLAHSSKASDRTRPYWMNILQKMATLLLILLCVTFVFSPALPGYDNAGQDILCKVNMVLL